MNRFFNSRSLDLVSTNKSVTLMVHACGRRMGCEGVDAVHLTARILVGLSLETGISKKWGDVHTCKVA